MKEKILYLFIGVAVLFTGCDKTLHEIAAEQPEDGNIVTVGLNTDKTPDAPLRDVHLFWFGETDQLYRHDYFNSMEELAQSRLVVPAGGYTILAVLNTGKDLQLPTPTRADLPDITLSEFTAWISSVSSKQ